MTCVCHASVGDVVACVSVATALYVLTVLPVMRYARAEHLCPQWVRDLPVTTAALLMLLSTPTTEVTS